MRLKLSSCVRPFTALALALAMITLGVVSDSTAQEVSFALNKPFLDRWNYPFNQNPGVRPTAPVFSSFLETDFFPDFDQRDGQFHIAFKTDANVETGLGPGAYTVTKARVTKMVATSDSFKYSLTLPLWQWYLPPTHPEFICPIGPPGNEPCPPNNTVIPAPAIKLFGVGFRNGFTPLSYQENTPYSPFGPFGKGHRTTYALDFDDAPGKEGEPRDVSNNIDGGYNPNPFALGTTKTVQLGDPVPANTTFTFDLDLEDPHIHNYLREGLDLGILHFMVATLHVTEQEVGGNIPEFYTKENILVEFELADAATLELTVIIDDAPKCGFADLNCDGSVGVADLLILLAAWGPCADPAPGECPADLTGNGQVGVADLLVLLSKWG